MCATQPQKERIRSTPDHKRPKINGLLRRLWDSDTQASLVGREEGKTTTTTPPPYCPSCPFTLSSRRPLSRQRAFELDPMLFRGSSLGQFAGSRKKVGENKKVTVRRKTGIYFLVVAKAVTPQLTSDQEQKAESERWNVCLSEPWERIHWFVQDKPSITLSPSLSCENYSVLLQTCCRQKKKVPDLVNFLKRL